MRRIAARYVYTLEDPEPIMNGFVEFDNDGTVIRTGKSEDTDGGEEILDGLIVPGFVNSHCHLELSYMKGLFRRGTGMAGFIDQINALRDKKPRKEKLEDIGHWMDVLWERGVSAMCDISNCDDSFEIKSEAPLYTRTFLEVFGTEPSDCASVMESVRALKKKADSFGLDAAPTPHACYTMSPDLLAEASAEALRSGYLSYHCEESEQESQMLKGTGAMYENRIRSGMSTPPICGKSALMYFLDRLEKVHPSPFEEHILLVHEVCLDQEGADAVKEKMKNAFFAICPLSNIYIHNALPPIGLMRENGLKITVGTDSLSSNDDLDMVKEIFCIQENFPEVPIGEMLRWACLNGAEFLGKENVLGSMKPGKKPGIVFVGQLDENGRLTTASASHRIV